MIGVLRPNFGDACVWSARRRVKTRVEPARAHSYSPCRALGSWRARSGRKFDFVPVCLFAAAVAAEVWADVAAATGVEGEPGRAAWRRIVAVAPLHEHDQGGSEFASLVGENVFGPAGTLWIWDALEHLLVAQQLESVGEHIGCDPEALLEILEPRYSENGVAEDQQRPALADDF